MTADFVKELADYLHSQFPATVGHIPLAEKLSRFGIIIESQQQKEIDWNFQSFLNQPKIEELQKEIEELQKDKARLDWLEENAQDKAGLTVGGICYWSVNKGSRRLSEGDDLREA